MLKAEQLAALGNYALEPNRLVYESWASTHFSDTFKEAAKLAGFDGYTMHVTISWNPATPHTLVVVQENGFSGTDIDVKELEVTGNLAHVLQAELNALAVTRMEKEIRIERENALRKEAQARVQLLCAQGS